MKKKVKLNDLKVSSFVTRLDNEERNNLQGGSGECIPDVTLKGCLTGNYPTLNDGCIQMQTTNGTIC